MKERLVLKRAAQEASMIVARMGSSRILCRKRGDLGVDGIS